MITDNVPRLDCEALQGRHVHSDAQARPVQRHRQGPVTPQPELVISQQRVAQRVGVPAKLPLSTSDYTQLI